MLCLFAGLLPGQTYDVRVLSSTAQGYPHLSDDQLPWYTFEMPSAGPANGLPLPPEVQLTVINASSIQVRVIFVLTVLA